MVSWVHKYCIHLQIENGTLQVEDSAWFDFSCDTNADPDLSSDADAGPDLSSDTSTSENNCNEVIIQKHLRHQLEKYFYVNLQ